VSSPFADAEREFVRWARVARLATVGSDGAPHVVPICPILHGEKILFASEAATAKVRNIRADPRVALAFDDYVEDWNALRGVTVHGTARIVEAGPEWELGRRLLYEKYPQYEAVAPITEGQTVLVEVAVERILGGL